MRFKVHCFFLLLLFYAAAAHAGAIRNLAGFTTQVFGPNDDGSYPCTGANSGPPPDCAAVVVPIGFSLNFYGVTFSNLYVNNNGNVTFDAPLSDYTPYGLDGTDSEIVAPFFADVDTRAGNVVTFGNDIVDGHEAFGVDWINVGYFATNTDKLDSFQLIFIDRSDRNAGDFDIEFNYDQVQWETGDASGGNDGLGGESAVAGYSNGSGIPGTSFQLSGSAIPGELLDDNPGGLIRGSLNTNVLGRYVVPIVNLTNTVLNVERFSQGDPSWASDTYDDSTFTIQQKGCALSCLAMALNYAGITTDPGALNTLLSDDDDFVGTAVSWDAATRDASDDTLEFHAYRTADTQYLSQMLAQGYPVIIGVNLNAQGAPGHFVLVIGDQNGHFLINDPGHADATTLDYYNNDFETRGYVGDPPGDVSGLDISVGNAANVLAVNSLGQRTGYDPASGMILQEIPQSVGFLDSIENSDLTGAPGTDTAHFLEIYQPLKGNYQIFLTGANSGSFQLALRSFSQIGASETPVIMDGTIMSNAMTDFEMNLAATKVASEPFTNEYAWSANPTNGLFPLAVQFTAPNLDSAGETVTNWSWNFGDGSTAYQQNPLHIYKVGGTFFPSLAAIDDTGATVVSLGTSIVLLSAQFTANPNYGTVPLTVQFMATNVDSGGNPIVAWNWDFGDGSTGAGQNPSHTYTNTGTFAPQLIATNNIGAAVTGVGPEVTVAIPTIPFTATPASGVVPLTVQFTSTNMDSAGNPIVAWNWDFGDGAVSTAQKPSHTYTNAGTFYPGLIATNSEGSEVEGEGPFVTVAGVPVYLGLVLNGGFETGDFTGWETNANFSDSIITSGAAYAHSGMYGGQLGPFGALGYLSQALATTAGTQYILSFWLDSPDGLGPNEFSAAWNGTVLFDETNIAAIGWTNIQFQVTATAASTILQFGVRDDPSYLGLDDISVVPVSNPPPGIRGLSMSGTDLVINGSNGQSGETYTTLMTTNFAELLSQWTPIATNVLGSDGNFTIMLTNVFSPGVHQRFYILQAQ